MGKLVKDMTPEELERKRAAARKRYEENAESVRAYQKNYRKANREKMNASRRERNKVSPPKRRLMSDMTPEQRERRRAQSLEATKRYQKRNRNKTLEAKKRHYRENKEKAREYRKSNKERISKVQRAWSVSNPEKTREYKSKYRKNNREKIRERVRNNITSPLRTRFTKAFAGNYKTGSAVRDLGCSIDEFRVHIENQFDEFMTWENRGTYWQFDHVYPLAKANLRDRVEFLAVANWRNYQPLEAGENVRKGNKVTPKARRLFESLKKKFST